MSKCIRGIPWYDTKIKDAAQTHQINKALDEAEAAPEQRDFKQGTAAMALGTREQARNALIFYPNDKTRYHTPDSKITVKASKEVGGFISKISNILGFNIKGGEYKYQEDTRFRAPRATNEDRTKSEDLRSTLWGSLDTNLNINTLNAEVFPVILSWLDTVNKISSKLKIPNIRAVRNTSSDMQREQPSNGGSMGDGTINISSLYFNKLFEAGNKLTEAQTKRLDQIAERIKELSNKSAQLDRISVYSDEHYIEMSELRDEHSKIANFQKFDADKAVSDYMMQGIQPPNIIEFYGTAEQRAIAIMYHEFGHHIHQQYGVKDANKLFNPDIEGLILWWSTRYSMTHLTEYSGVNRPRAIGLEWFAENHAYWAMDKYEGVAPLGKSEEVLDSFFIFLMDIIEKGVGTQPSGSRVLNKNALRPVYVHEQIMQAVDKYLEEWQ